MKKFLLFKVGGIPVVRIKSRILTVAVLGLLLFVNYNAYANKTWQTKEITLKVEGVTLAELFNQIEQTTEYRFVYSINDIDVKKKISLDVKDIQILPLLKKVLPSRVLTFKKIENQIIIRKRKPSKEIDHSDASDQVAQERVVVRGVVTDDTNVALPGVNVVIKGQGNGTATDIDGAYTLNVLPGETLVFSYVGFESQEELVGSRREINVQMKTGILLSEVVLTSSYGTKIEKQNEVSSSVTITAERISNLPQTRVDKLLDGIVPGLQYSPQSNSANSARPRHSVTIRGEASLTASNEPLWIIDGTRMHTGDKTNMIAGLNTSISPLSFINPQDIESIKVLKDAAATSIYGADGANGVILITTKRGKKGKLSFDVSLRRGQSFINEGTRFKTLNGSQYLELAKEAYRNVGNDMNYFPFSDNKMNNYSNTNTDWYDNFYDIGSNSMVNVSAMGGSENGTYYISGSYFNEKGTVKGNDTQRFSLRTRNTTRLSSKMDIDLSMSASYNLNEIFNPGSDYYENIPILSPYNSDGTFRQYYQVIEGSNSDGSPNWVTKRFFNSLAEREQNDNNQKAFAFQGNFRFSYKPFEFLSYTGQFGADYQNNTEDIYYSMKNWSGKDSDGNPIGTVYNNQSNFFTWTMIHRMNFDKRFDKHHISGVVGFEMSSSQNNYTGARGSGFVNDNLRRVNSAAERFGSASYYEQNKMSYLGQVSYNYDNRYNASISLRRDGNSNFGKNVRWAEFASAGVSWNIHREDFFKSDLINVLKLKGSYGTNGNSRIGNQETDGVYSINDSDYYGGLPGATMSSAPNPNLSWETTYMANLGVLVSAFDNRISFELEGYRNKTVDLLSRLDVSRTIGATRIYRNVGSIENKGLELTLRTKNINTENFYWGTDFLASKNKNKILELYGGIPKNIGNYRLEEGKDINTYYLIRWAGIDPRDGAPLWYDANGNVTRQYNADNRVAYKSSAPDLFGSVTNTLKYKQFSLIVQATYNIGGYSFSPFGRDVNSDGLNIMDQNQSIDQLDRWQQPGDIASVPKLLWGVSTRSVMNSTRYLFNKTNLRLQNVTLNYQLPQDVTRQLGAQNVVFSLIGDNLGIWTPYDVGHKNSYRNNISGFPMETMVSLGANIQF